MYPPPDPVMYVSTFVRAKRVGGLTTELRDDYAGVMKNHAESGAPALRYELKRSQKAPINYTQDEKSAVIEDVFNGMADGRVMSETLEPYGLNAGTVRRWIASDEYWFYEYRKARLLMAQALAEEALQISRLTDNRTVTRDKLQIDTLQWAAIRMNPAEFGDKQQIQTDSKQTVEIRLIEEESEPLKISSGSRKKLKS